MEIKNKEKVNELLKLLFLSLLIGFLGFTISPVLIMFIYPGIFMEGSIRLGLRDSLLVMFLTSLILSLFSNLMSGLALFFIFAPMVLTFHYGIMNRKSYIFIYISVLLVLALSMTAFQLGLLRTQPIDLTAAIESLMNAQLDLMKEGLTALEFSQLEQSLKEAYSIMPSLYLVILAIIVYINYNSVGRNLLLKGILIPQPPFFGYLQMPRQLIVAFGIGIFIPLMMKNLGLDLYRPIYFNIIVVFGFLFFVDGLALLSSLLNKARIPRFFRILIIVMAIFIAPLTIVVAIVGILDTLVQFRRIKIVGGK